MTGVVVVLVMRLEQALYGSDITGMGSIFVGSTAFIGL